MFLFGNFFEKQIIFMISREKTLDATLKVHEAFRNLISTITETTKSELSYLGEKIISNGKGAIPLLWEMGGM